MRSEGPTSSLLNNLTGWRTGKTVMTAVGESIRLAADPEGDLAPDSKDGSLGRLVLPRGMAFDDDYSLYLLTSSGEGSEAAQYIKRYDGEQKQFVTLATIGGLGREVRQFHNAVNIAILGNILYVADQKNHRVQVFDLDSLGLLHVWGGARRKPWPTYQGKVPWYPVDVFAVRDKAYILDKRYGRVFLHQAGMHTPKRLVDVPRAADRWSRVIVDEAGWIYLYDAIAKKFDIYDERGRWLASANDPGDVRDRFPTPVIYKDDKGRFVLPESLSLPCGRHMPDKVLPADVDFTRFIKDNVQRLFNSDGTAARLEADVLKAPQQLYSKKGIWISAALDSQIYQCQWHRVELTLGDLPPGASIIISTFTDNGSRPMTDIAALDDQLWETNCRIIAPMQTLAAPAKDDAQKPTELLVQSGAGQYLWLRLKLVSDGYVSPAIHAVRVHYPRESYLQYLPAIYAADDESRLFLEHFLAIVQTEWESLETKISNTAAFFDPKAVETGVFMNMLANWLAVPLEGDWNWEQKRRMLEAVPRIYSHRGTLESLRDYLRVYLQNITGLPAEHLYDFPQIVEGFRERQHMILAMEHNGNLGIGAPLWGAGVVKRLQLGGNAREGEVELVSTGSPESDYFHEYAHRFRIFVPAVWVKDAKTEAMLRRALDAEKPAHTQYDLCLVQSCFRLDEQCCIGFDTILGDYPKMQLGEAVDPSSVVPTLGTNAVLAGRPKPQTNDYLSPGIRLEN